MKKFVIFTLFAHCLVSCYSPGHHRSVVDTCRHYSQHFNTGYHTPLLLLGCIVFAENKRSNNIKNGDSTAFLNLAANFSSFMGKGINIDDAIDSLVNSRADFDFNSFENIHDIDAFIMSYEVVDNIIFAKMDSDDKDDEMRDFENKLASLPEVLSIYRKYVSSGRNMASLSPVEGIALDIHLAYYLKNIDVSKRNLVIKRLL